MGDKTVIGIMLGISAMALVMFFKRGSNEERQAGMDEALSDIDRRGANFAVDRLRKLRKDNLFGFAALASESSGSTVGRSFFPVNGSGKGQLPRTEDEASSQAVEEAIDAASQAVEEVIDVAVQVQPPPPTAFVITRPDGSAGPVLAPDIDDTDSNTTRYLMWGAAGLVVASGIGYIVWKLSKKPKGMEANTGMERWHTS